MQSKEREGVIFIRLFPNESIHDELIKACSEHRIETAVVLSGVGQLKEFKLGYYKRKGDYMPEEFSGPHELLSLAGNISNQDGEYNLHLHATLGNEKKGVIGGHLIQGKVEVTNEIVLLGTRLRIERRLVERTGLQEMFLE